MRVNFAFKYWNNYSTIFNNNIRMCVQTRVGIKSVYKIEGQEGVFICVINHVLTDLFISLLFTFKINEASRLNRLTMNSRRAWPNTQFVLYRKSILWYCLNNSIKINNRTKQLTFTLALLSKTKRKTGYAHTGPDPEYKLGIM